MSSSYTDWDCYFEFKRERERERERERDRERFFER